MQAKYIFITGGVLSSLGKGIAGASIGALLEARGLRVTFLKLDPYINVDPGTMNPLQHGEVLVTDDGQETDLDLGHYERFTSARMGSGNNCTSGQIYEQVITKERRGEYLGETVQVIPHITDAIKDKIRAVASDTDVAIIEIGGTVGDIESQPFIESIRQFKHDVGADHVLYIHLTLVPYVAAAGQLKTKPTQHGVKELLQNGIQPDILLCRSDRMLPGDIKEKLALFCNLSPDCVVTAKDVSCIYEVPLLFHHEKLDDKIITRLNIWARAPQLEHWHTVVERCMYPMHATTIAIVGKYVDLEDAYKSLNEALTHGGIANNARVQLKFIDSETLENSGACAQLDGVHGILVPGGFGQRGIEGKIRAIRHAREHAVPFLGICLGMQLAAIEFARGVCGLPGADSVEFDADAADPLFILLTQWYDHQKQQEQFRSESFDYGATMRLGAYPCRLTEGSLAADTYRKTMIHERHRHRYEFNNRYRERLEQGGLAFTGMCADADLVEIIELPGHPWFIGCQFHPEFNSRPLAPHPLFSAFIAAACAHTQPALEGPRE